MNTAETMQATIDRRAFQLVYQPIVDLDSGEVAGVEALCRFEDGRSPQRWFEESEAVGLAADLDLAIIETALAEVPKLPPGYLSLNLSPTTLIDPRLVELLGSPGVPHRRLVLEITEHAQVLDYHRPQEVLAALRRKGIQLAVDDAGAGHATFRHVLRLRPDIIKMDRSITQHINEEPARMALATALVIFAGEVGATLIAEGVETCSELRAVRAAGVSRAQGFALARPQSLPLVAIAADRLPIGGRWDRTPTPVGAAPPWAGFHDGNSAAVAAHELLSPVGGVELALELLSRKTEVRGEDESAALVATAQRQMHMIGSVLHDLVHGTEPGGLLVLDEVSRTHADPLLEPVRPWA